MKRTYLLLGTLIGLVGVLIGVSTAGACSWWNGCSNKGTYAQENTAIESNQARLLNIHGIPYTTDSEEMKNLVRRITAFNNPNKISYIYLYSFGKLIMYDTVKGKVSAVDSSLTSQTQLVGSDGNPCNGRLGYDGDTACYVVPAPAADGSYGTNGGAIFYFNENGAYREWHGDYILSDQPLILTNQPDLVKAVK